MPTFLPYNKTIILFKFETLHIIQRSERYEYYHITKDVFFDNQTDVETIILFKTLFKKYNFIQMERKEKLVSYFHKRKHNCKI